LIQIYVSKYVTYTGLELTPWGRVLFDELILSFELVKRFHSFHGSE